MRDTTVSFLHKSINMEFSNDEKYAIMAILTLIMEADAITHPKEIEFMDEMMQTLGISVRDLDCMETVDLSLAKRTVLAMSSPKQQAAKHWFHRMAEADGNVDPRETHIVDEIFGE